MSATPARAVWKWAADTRHQHLKAGTCKPHLQLTSVHLPVEVNGLMEVPGKAAIISSHISPQTLVPSIVCLRLDLYLTLHMLLQAWKECFSSP